MVRKKQSRPRSRASCEPVEEGQPGPENGLVASIMAEIAKEENLHAFAKRQKKRADPKKIKNHGAVGLVLAEQGCQRLIGYLKVDCSNVVVDAFGSKEWYFEASGSRIAIKSNNGDAISFLNVSEDDAVALLDCSKAALVSFGQPVCRDSSECVLPIYLTERAFQSLKSSFESSKMTKLSKNMFQLLRSLRGEEFVLSTGVANDNSEPRIVLHPTEDDDVELDASKLYSMIKPSGREQSYDCSLDGLNVTLLPYQRRALHWMVNREKNPSSFAGAQSGNAHILWTRIEYLDRVSLEDSCSQKNGRCFFVNQVTGMLSDCEPIVPPPPKGGIACDEMGLGKTIEVLSLIMANPLQDSKTPQKVIPLVKDEQKEEGFSNECKNMACICGTSYVSVIAAELDHRPTIQCVECKFWSHRKCVGIRQKGSNVPSPWKCSQCLAQELGYKNLIDAKTTLIVCPTPILAQWEAEIRRHTKKNFLKVMTYLGQPQPLSNKVLIPTTPQDIANFDIVLTTYDVLREDLHRNPDREESKTLRYQKRYQVIPTPLTSVKFWRIAVDEAQMVESSTAKATAMAMKIPAVNRWCITGTPISRGLEDLFGLLKFLNVSPFNEQFWWRKLVQEPLEKDDERGNQALNRLIRLLKPSSGGLMWRSSKADVENEIGIPEQTILDTNLVLSKIERHFYQRQHETCAGAARRSLPKSALRVADEVAATIIATNKEQESSNDQTLPKKKDRLLTRREERKVLQPLVRLRQACVHPQVGAGGIRSLSQMGAPMSMEDVLSILVSRAKQEAEDAQRALFAAMNGLAGLSILQSDYATAASHYRSVISLSRTNKETVRTDKLQILHSMYNLLDIVSTKSLNIGRAIHDDFLEKDVNQLKENYLREPLFRVALAEKELQSCTKEAKKIQDDCHALGNKTGRDSSSMWFAVAIHYIIKYSSDDKGINLVKELKEHLSQDDVYRHAASQNASTIASRFRNHVGLIFTLNQECEKMNESREDVISQLESLGTRISARDSSLISSAAHCSACRSFNATGLICEHCELDKKMMSWEFRIFTMIASSRGKATLSADAVAAAVHRRNLSRVGRGGLGEDGDMNDAAILGPKRSDNKVSDSKVLRSPSEVEKVLKFIANKFKNITIVTPEEKKEVSHYLAQAKVFLDIMELRRREFSKAVILASAQRQALYSMDELDMCTMRMRLRHVGVPISEDEERYILYEYEIPGRKAEIEVDYSIAEAELKKSMGTVRYLQSIAAANIAPQNQGENSNILCPVCHENIPENEMAMPPCGHALCMKCNIMIIERESAKGSRTEKVSKCPTCRAITPAVDVAMVAKHPANEPKVHEKWPGEAKVYVKGSFSTKIERVVRRICAVKKSAPEEKIIVFSLWKDALDILSHALSNNGIPYLYPKNKKLFDSSIQSFQAGANSPKVLLLLLKQGGNGLNLQQAQHIMFVEPVLDPGDEAQAIGRIDRMGQTKKTFVHKFIVTSTIEENVAKISAHKKQSEGKKTKTSNRQKLSIGEVAALLHI